MKTARLSLALVCTILLVGSVQFAQAADLFPDKNLEAAVRKQVFEKRNNKKPLTEKDVQNISVVFGKNMKIKSLKGLEKCRSLAALDLEGNQITDLSPIKDLKMIQTINLKKNKIKDIKPLAGLTALQYIQLENNQVSDLKPLMKMKNLRSLYLSYNKITDMKPVSGLSKIWSISLAGNKVTNLQPLAKLKWLSTLDLTGNGVTDLKHLAKLTELRYLMLGKNKIKDISVLVAMAQKDSKGSQRFAPFWRIYLNGNPLDKKKSKGQIESLSKLGAKISMKKYW